MQSNNPVFRRSDEFKAGGRATYNDPSTWGVAQGGQTYGQPYGQTPYGQPQQPPPPTPARTPASTGPMTIDSVVQKSAISFGTVVVMAFVTWLVTPDVTSDANLGPLFAALTIGSLGAFALSMVNSFKRVISPALVIAFCALEGVALGAFSKVVDAAYGASNGSVVIQAVVGTFAAFAGTLAVYKFANVQVGQKFRTMVMAAMFGMVGLVLLNLVLGLFGANLGINGFGPIGLLFSIAGLVLGVFMLVLDFDFVEQGIRNGLPERESWRAAFAMTVSLVWIYTNLLRILAILQND